jgi:hypothetical protein
MIKLIVGTKGSGKTKRLIDMINDSVTKVNGNIVCIEKSMQSTYHISPKCRLIDMDEYRISDYDTFYGFFAGILAGNYDIEEVYIDGLMRIGSHTQEDLAKLLNKMDALAKDQTIIITVSAAEEDLIDEIKKYL